jgi:hypothetical protein
VESATIRDFVSNSATVTVIERGDGSIFGEKGPGAADRHRRDRARLPGDQVDYLPLIEAGDPPEATG